MLPEIPPPNSNRIPDGTASQNDGLFWYESFSLNNGFPYNLKFGGGTIGGAGQPFDVTLQAPDHGNQALFPYNSIYQPGDDLSSVSIQIPYASTLTLNVTSLVEWYFNSSGHYLSYGEIGGGNVLSFPISGFFTLTVNNGSTTPIGSATAANVPFKISGLNTGDTGTATFTDGINQISVLVSGSQSSYTVNLGSLTDGTVSSSLTINNSTVSGNSVALDQDIGEQNALSLVVNNGTLVIGVGAATSVPFTVSGLDSEDTLASFEAKISEVQADTRVKANQVLADMRKKREEFSDTLKKHADANEASRNFTKKLPNPRSSTRSPRAIAAAISEKMVLTIFSASCR